MPKLGVGKSRFPKFPGFNDLNRLMRFSRPKYFEFSGERGVKGDKKPTKVLARPIKVLGHGDDAFVVWRLEAKIQKGKKEKSLFLVEKIFNPEMNERVKDYVVKNNYRVLLEYKKLRLPVPTTIRLNYSRKGHPSLILTDLTENGRYSVEDLYSSSMTLRYAANSNEVFDVIYHAMVEAAKHGIQLDYGQWVIQYDPVSKKARPFIIDVGSQREDSYIDRRDPTKAILALKSQSRELRRIFLID